MKLWNNILIIAGTSSNVGKTTLACSLIKKLSGSHKVTAIKIIPHFNSACKLCISVLNEDEYIIYEEKSTNTDNDSSLMLAAGADKVLFIQAKGKGLKRCIDKLITYLPKDSPVIVESAALLEFVKPGCMLLLSGDKPMEKNKHLINIANFHITGQNYTDIKFNNGKWEF